MRLLMCISLSDSRQLEGYLEQSRHKYEESKDPVVQQLQSMVDAFRTREQANEPMYEQLNSLGSSLQANLEQNKSMQSYMDGAMKRVVSK